MLNTANVWQCIFRVLLSKICVSAWRHMTGRAVLKLASQNNVFSYLDSSRVLIPLKMHQAVALKGD